MRFLALALVMFFLGLALTQVEREPRIFTPVVRVRTDDGFFMTLVQSQANKNSACIHAVNNLVADLEKTCPTCWVESTDCSAKLTGIEQALAHRDPVPLYVVSSNEIRIALLGPPQSLAAECDAIAKQMKRLGVQSAGCIPPVMSSPTS